MADTQYVTKNRLTLEAKESRKKVLVFGLPIIFILCLVSPIAGWWFFCVLLIIFFNAGTIKRAGARGEDSTHEMLTLLPDSYTVFNQVFLPNAKSRTGYTELDFIVIGPNGIFVIEVKNNNSEIIGSKEDREWIISKIGRRGTPYTSSMRNPIKQVNGQIWLLRNILQEKNQKAWIQGIVFFPNSCCCVNFQGTSSVPIIQHNGITDYIQNYKLKYPIKEREKIISELAAIKLKHHA